MKHTPLGDMTHDDLYDEIEAHRSCLDEINEALKGAGYPTVAPTPGPDGDEGVSPTDQVGAMAARVAKLREWIVVHSAEPCKDWSEGCERGCEDDGDDCTERDRALARLLADKRRLVLHGRRHPIGG